MGPVIGFQMGPAENRDFSRGPRFFWPLKCMARGNIYIWNNNRTDLYLGTIDPETFTDQMVERGGGRSYGHTQRGEGSTKK